MHKTATRSKPKAMLIPVKGDPKPIEPANGETFTLEELQTYVGGYVEVMPLRSPAKILVVNEEGKLHGLPVNFKASKIAARPHDFVVGDAVHCPAFMFR
jgi:hypothetical protein